MFVMVPGTGIIGTFIIDSIIEEKQDFPIYKQIQSVSRKFLQCSFFDFFT